MDAFTIVVAGGMLLGLIAILAVGYFYPGSGADVIDWKPTRSPEVEAQNELDDIEQMLEAQNARRRRRGKPELTEEDFERRVAEDKAELIRIQQKYRAERDEQTPPG